MEFIIEDWPEHSETNNIQIPPTMVFDYKAVLRKAKRKRFLKNIIITIPLAGIELYFNYKLAVHNFNFVFNQ